MRAISHYIRGRLSLLPVMEALALIASLIASYQLRFDNPGDTLPILHGIIFASIMMVSMASLGLYSGDPEPFVQVVQKITTAYVATLLGATVLFYLFPDTKFGRGVFAIASSLSLISLLLLRYFHQFAVEAKTPARKVLVVGSTDDIKEIEQTITRNNVRAASRIAGLYPLSDLEQKDNADSSFAVRHIPERVRQQGIREIVVATKEQRNGAVPMELLLNLRMEGTKVYNLLSFYEREIGLIKLDHLKHSWLIFGDGFEQGNARAILKRAFDLLASVSLAIIASPIMLLTALAIWLETGGPILFTQTRSGAKGKDFTLFKFRSMRVDAENDGQPTWATKGDQRVTRVGHFIRRTRIDELPQLVNVISGEMSFVGPRPERPFFVNQLREEVPFYELRHKVKPGITGWAQVRLPYAASVADTRSKLEYDLYYVKNNSIFFDALILLETVRVVASGSGR